ncbi:MAG: hypothetical protein BWY83_00496 [bacterium ADurb.Bin478]|nr:MAG: hypothetical protein BWY83_00496 [bacterium ADurb.Bin478]
MQHHLGVVVVQVKGFVFDLFRRRQVFDDRIQQRLHALVFKSRTDKHRYEIKAQSALAHGAENQIFVDPVFQVGFGQLIVIERHAIDQLIPFFQRDGQQFGRDALFADDFSVGAVKIIGFHRNQIDDTLELALQPDGPLHQGGGVVEFIMQLIGHPLRIGAHTIALVHKSDAGNLITRHLAVHRDGLRLHTANGA